MLFRWGLYASLGVLAIAAAAAAVYTARAVLIRALIALFLAISLDPPSRWLTRCHPRRRLAIDVIIVVTLSLAAAFLQSVIPAMADQFDALVKDFPGYLASLQHRSASFRELSDRSHLTSQIETLLASLPARLGTGLLGLTGRLFSALASALTVAVLTLYFMADLPRLRRGAVLLFPQAHRAQAGRIADVLIDKVGAYMIGNIVGSIVAGLAAFAALAGLGVPFAVPLAFVVAVTVLISMIGATLGAAICVLVALARHQHVAGHGASGCVLRALPAAGELPDSTASHARLGHAQPGGGTAGRLDRRRRPRADRRPDGDPGCRRGDGPAVRAPPGPRRSPRRYRWPKAAGVMTNVSHHPTRPAHGIHVIGSPADQDGRQALEAGLTRRAPRNLEQATCTGGGTMATVELTKREADALSKATKARQYGRPGSAPYRH
jgi:predicted PurR-regulated permease PerM